jgi:16S rRNA (cytidine1402-2'-O)-methyltransferase
MIQDLEQAGAIGKLLVIGTPIGNLHDLTLRAISALGSVETLYCEDSRVTARLINYLLEHGQITTKPRYVPYNEFNEQVVALRVIADVAAGKTVGLVSDAGMPGLSDPGYRAIRGCLDAGLPVEIIPGVTALTTALTASGTGGELCFYAGFLPKTSGKATRVLAGARAVMTELPATRLVLYVSPHRLAKDLTLIKEVIGDADCVLMRELTKQHEERIVGTVSELLARYERVGVKGELVLIVTINV